MMLNRSTPPPTQMLLRLPDDIAARLSRAVPPRKRNQFLVDLLRRELEKEDAELVAACEAMNRLEAAHPQLMAESTEWTHADLTSSVDDWDPGFDAAKFSRDAAVAQAAMTTFPSQPSALRRRHRT